MKKVIEKCKKAEVYMYLIPSMVIFSIFLFYPFFKTIYLSLYKTNKLGEAKLYVGLDNYKSYYRIHPFTTVSGLHWNLWRLL